MGQDCKSEFIPTEIQLSEKEASSITHVILFFFLKKIKYTEVFLIRRVCLPEIQIAETKGPSVTQRAAVTSEKKSTCPGEVN